MKAIILAAGQGTRLCPLTDDRPKCLVELAGQSLLNHHLHGLRANGIDDIVIVGGYRADMLPVEGGRVRTNPDFDRTNMVATLFSVADELTPETDILITYGDCIYEPGGVAAVMNTDAPIAMAIDLEWRRFWEQRMSDPLSDAETLRLSEGGDIIELGKKPKSYADIEGQYMGLFKLRADHVHQFKTAWDSLDPDGVYDGKDRANMYMTSFLQHLIDTGWTIRSEPVENGWLEVDTTEDIARYEDMHTAGQLEQYCKLIRTSNS